MTTPRTGSSAMLSPGAKIAIQSTLKMSGHVDLHLQSAEKSV
jgi:hypothetical protein